MNNLYLIKNNFDKESENIKIINNEKSLSMNICQFVLANYEILDKFDNIFLMFKIIDGFDEIKFEKTEKIHCLTNEINKINFPIQDFAGNKHKSYIQRLYPNFEGENFAKIPDMEPFLDDDIKKAIYIMHQLNLNFKNLNYMYDCNLSYVVNNKFIINKSFDWWAELEKFLSYIENELNLKYELDRYMTYVWPVIFLSTKIGF